MRFKCQEFYYQNKRGCEKYNLINCGNHNLPFTKNLLRKKIRKKCTYILRYSNQTLKFKSDCLFRDKVLFLISIQLQVEIIDSWKWAHILDISWNEVVIKTLISRKYGNLGTHIYLFCKNFVKVSFLIKKLLQNWFDEIFFYEWK